ncbi:MAG: DUF262 domain-containing protein [Alistipes sp.]|nr:DUF262 domain-containing protein [Alistipes sp.]
MDNSITTPLKSGFHTPITINTALQYIRKGEYLLPAIQRKFVWSSEQIEVLFDSIMRGYPINSFMMWHVTDANTKCNNKFYRFISEYREFYQDENIEQPTKGCPDFLAVIDGQQRLTSLYIGLMGSYAYKLPRKHWEDSEDNIPTRHLYINLSSPIKENERNMKFEFEFLTENQFNERSTAENWFKVSDIYLYHDEETLDSFLESEDWTNTRFAKSTLRQLRRIVFDQELINYYQEENQDLDTVLDIFIRTNSGGQPLSFSNLLMSITTSYWKIDARKEFKALIKSISECGFMISSDLILKCWLVVGQKDIKFKVSNFNTESINEFEEKWERIKACMINAFRLLKKWGFNESSLRAKNAIIPIVYFIYHNNLEDEILKDNKHENAKCDIRKWLCISILKGVFGGQSDNVLKDIRDVLKKHHGDNTFPFKEIKDVFASNDAKSLSFSDEVVEDILKTQYQSSNCFTILALLYSHLHFDRVAYDQDHIHPQTRFKNLKESEFQNKAKYEFYTNKEVYNSILNLQLLSSSTNKSKNADSLKEWINSNNINLNEQLIPEDASLEFNDFEEFIAKRKELLKKRIKDIIGL